MGNMDLFNRAITDQMRGNYLAEVVSVQDPDNLARVQIRFLSYDGIGEQDGPVWARVAVAFAGNQCGSFFIPDVGDEVLVSFVNNDPRMAVIIGSFWNGRDAPPETLGGSGDSVDRWAFVGKAGSRIAIVEESASTATIELTTANGVSATLTDEAGGKVEIVAAGNTITIDSSGVKIDSPAKVEVNASTVEVNSGMVTVNAALSSFNGVVKCDVLQATTVVASTYTPGAGNVW